jgi:hypothetical protein
MNFMNSSYPAGPIAAIIAQHHGGTAADYVDGDGRVIDLFVAPQSMATWVNGRAQWAACQSWDEKQFDGINYIVIKGARGVTHAQPRDFLVFDLKDGGTAIWPCRP